MTDVTPRQQRLDFIEVQRAEAARLMSAANHDTMKAHVRLAVRDLDEATIFLNEKDVDHRPNILKMADLAVEIATARMAIVAKALADYGPDAMEIG